MESDTYHFLTYKYLKLGENRIGVLGVREISKANWNRRTKYIDLGKNTIRLEDN